MQATATTVERNPELHIWKTGQFLDCTEVTVFNVEQIDGLPALYYAKAALQLDPVAGMERTENFFAASKATIRHGDNRAYYAQELD